MRRKQRRTWAIGALAVVSLVAAAAACGDDDDTTGEAATTEATGDGSEDGSSENGSASEDGSADENGDAGGPDRLLPPGEQHVGDEGEPVHGGDLVFGIEADSADPWAPYRVSCATACYVLLTSVSDPLFTATDEGEIAPVLVESYEANDDYTEWTFEIREGITFQDGTPLDGAAVEFNMESCQYSPLTASALLWIEDISSSGQTVTVTTNEPYVEAPRQFTERQCAYMFSPTWLRTLDDVPQRDEELPIYDEELAAEPADGDAAEPIGLGAFEFESYTPGNGNSFQLRRNEDYWRGPNGVTGEELPYLDSVEGVVAVDIDSRSNGLRSGQFDIIHTSNADTIYEFQQDDSFEVISTSLYGDTSFIMLNVAEGDIDPDGDNADSPLLNVHCRRALAHATDSERLVEERAAGLTLVANGPFGPGMDGYLEDSGYPEYDPDAALEEFETCLSELGTEGIEFTFNTTNDPYNVETNQLMISMWDEVFGDRIEATITPIEQGQYIGLALTGTFDAFGWRNHGGIAPATQAYWWQSASSAPVGESALNFGRFTNPEIDELLQVTKGDPDPDARREAAEEINRIFGEQVYNLWTSWALWAIIEHPYVNGVESNALPDGGDGVGLAFSGRHQMNQIWCDTGTCD